jgi:hypothetical protein
MKIRPQGAVRTDRRTDTTTLNVAFPNFAKEPKKATLKEGRQLIEKVKNFTYVLHFLVVLSILLSCRML